jgi:hypothetical protein
VTAYTTSCAPPGAGGGGPDQAARFAALGDVPLTLGAPGALTVDERGADPRVAAQLSAQRASPCTPRVPDPSSEQAVLGRSPGVTLLGLPVITATVDARGPGGQVDARLWDRDPATGTQQLVARGVYALEPDQQGPMLFPLDGGGWRFPPGHEIVLEVLGRDAPTYAPSAQPFSATLRDVAVTLPTASAG